MEGGKLTIVPKDGRQEQEDRVRLERFLETLQRLEGTGDQEVDANQLMEMTRDR